MCRQEQSRKRQNMHKENVVPPSENVQLFGEKLSSNNIINIIPNLFFQE